MAWGGDHLPAAHTAQLRILTPPQPLSSLLLFYSTTSAANNKLLAVLGLNGRCRGPPYRSMNRVLVLVASERGHMTTY